MPKKIINYKYPLIKTCIFGISFYCLICLLSYYFFILNLDNTLTNKDFFILAIVFIFKYYYFSSIHKFLYNFDNENINYKKINKYEIFIRFISSFFIISIIVFIGKINEIIGIIMSVFPLLSIINSIILWNKTNNPILISQLNSNILIGGTSIYMYVLCFGFFLNILELYSNVIISLLISLIIYNFPIYIVLKKINVTDNKNMSANTMQNIVITEV